VNGELMRLGSGECLVHGQEPIEPAAGDPAFLVDELAPEHRDLGDRAAEREQPEPEEPTEDRERWVRQLAFPVPNWRSPASPSPGMM
jgi:hypothetical protein